MNLSFLVVDDFYNNPDEVRDFALQQDFGVKGNYPGARTRSFFWEDTKRVIQNLIYPVAGNVVNWMDQQEESYSGSFQYTTCADRTWIHADTFNKWSGVCYLTPDAPLTSGTAMYLHKATKSYLYNTEADHDQTDYTKWDRVDTIGNRYNRLILFRGSIYHAALDYFGTGITTGRLFQVFFFDTEN
jgi:hypothetical protein